MRKCRTLAVAVTLGSLLTFSGCSSASESSVTSSVSAGSFASVSIHGAPNTTYSITVIYNSGKSTASGLEDVTSDSNGNTSWSWKVGTRTKSVTYPITVSGGGQSESTSFSVY